MSAAEAPQTSMRPRRNLYQAESVCATSAEECDPTAPPAPGRRSVRLRQQVVGLRLEFRRLDFRRLGAVSALGDQVAHRHDAERKKGGETSFLIPPRLLSPGELAARWRPARRMRGLRYRVLLLSADVVQARVPAVRWHRAGVLTAAPDAAARDRVQRDRARRVVTPAAAAVGMGAGRDEV
jgi:hypothetical protein